MNIIKKNKYFRRMRQLGIQLYILTLSVVAFCQSGSNNYEFVGVLSLRDKTVISYKINFEELSNGKIDGVSITDFVGVNATKSRITGTIDHSRHLLSFREIVNISTKSDEAARYFCYVEVKNAKFKVVKDKIIINAGFTGKYTSGENCASGTIYLVSAKILDEIKPMLDSLKGVNSDTLNKLKSLLAEAGKSANDRKSVMKKDNNMEVAWSGDYVIFDVWDGNKEDNDMINIYFNGKLVEENLLMRNEKKTIVVPFKGESGYIRIKAVNEGEEKPNTVNFLLHDGKVQNPFISSLNMGEEFTIKFNRKK